MTSAPLPDAAATPLRCEPVYLEEKDFFRAPVVLSTDRDALLVDTGLTFSGSDRIIDHIQSSGKRLTTILVTCCDPDYYWGLWPVHRRFPDASIVAMPSIVESIRHTAAHKLTVWQPQLGSDAPRTMAEIIVPDALGKPELMFGGHRLHLSPSSDPHRAWNLFVPSLRALIGPVGVVSGVHNWFAETRGPAERDAYVAELDRLALLKPLIVVPGHIAPGFPSGPAAITATRAYNVAFEEVLGRSANSAAVIDAMKRRFPSLAIPLALELSARVCSGEMSWP